ncbi:MAG: OmpA family protein, partial [Gammaproteobacteria bacterium]
ASPAAPPAVASPESVAVAAPKPRSETAPAPGAAAAQPKARPIPTAPPTPLRKPKAQPEQAARTAAAAPKTVPAPASTAAPDTTTPIQPEAAPDATPVFSLPKDVRNQVEIVASATRVNLVVKDDVLFAPGSAELRPAGRTVLSRLADLLGRDPFRVSVEGYTDGTPIHTARFPSNWELSTARATMVTRFLIAHGVASSRLSAIGYGATRPRADNATPAGRARNRRVSLVVHLNKRVDAAGDVAGAKRR